MIAINSDNVVFLNTLTDNTTSGLITTATVTGTLYEQIEMTTIYNFSLSYTGSGGTYSGTIPYATTATLDEGATYLIRLVAIASVGQLTIDISEIAGYY